GGVRPGWWGGRVPRADEALRGDRPRERRRAGRALRGAAEGRDHGRRRARFGRARSWRCPRGGCRARGGGDAAARGGRRRRSTYGRLAQRALSGLSVTIL